MLNGCGSGCRNDSTEQYLQGQNSLIWEFRLSCSLLFTED